MKILATLATCMMLTAAASAAPADPAASTDAVDWVRARPGARLAWKSGSLSRLYGRDLATGPSPAASVEAFLADAAAVLGVAPADLAPQATHAVPLGYDPATGEHRFTAFRFEQRLGGVPVFGTRLIVLVRNDGVHPVVLASCDLREIGAFAPPVIVADLDALRPQWRRVLDPRAVITDEATVLWAGLRGREVAPRPAVRFIARTPGPPRPSELLCVADAVTGVMLHQEERVHGGTIEGVVEGVGSSPLGSDVCTDAATVGLPYARVTAGGAVGWADADGNYTLDTGTETPATVQSAIRGPYFRVYNQAGVDALITRPVDGGPVDFLHNATDTWEFDRAQVNAYVHANVVRDFVLETNPDYPGIASMSEFQVKVNLSSDCNAFYQPGPPASINFFTSGAGCPNTAFDTIVYHEFGHHLVHVGGSGQLEYGEGMSDCLAILVTDQPVVGVGWYGPCDGWLRRGDNDCFYSPSSCTSNCGSAIHACGRLLSGSVWSLRNALLATEPDDYRRIVSSLTLDSIVLHDGTAIDPDITIDLLTLDDDDANLANGTPHYNEIAAAFGAHGLPGPPLDLLDFEFPDGLPRTVDPDAGATFAVNVLPADATPAPGTGTLHVSTEGPDGPYAAVPMSAVGPDAYEATLPPVACGVSVHFHVSAASTDGVVQQWPTLAPLTAQAAVGATGVVDAFDDDFEIDTGWIVANDAGVTGGAWERGTPAGLGDRGDPVIDADGSGQCYLTGNAAGNSDVDGGATTLTSAIVGIPGNTPVVLSYWRWYANTGGANPGQDVFTVEASADGAAWVEVETVGPEGAEVDGGWILRQFRVDELLPGATSVAVRFTAADTEPPSVVEAAVDGVRVEVFQCAADCTADVTGDGEVDVDDLVAVIVAWSTADPAADVNADGEVDVDDLVAVVVAWGECPN